VLPAPGPRDRDLEARTWRFVPFLTDRAGLAWISTKA
jgi:hypothetical protein